MRTARLTERQRRLAADHYGLAIGRGKTWARRMGWDADDLIGAASVGLCLAAKGAKRGRDFTAYARPWIDGEILREIRSAFSTRGPEIKDQVNPPRGEGFDPLYRAMDSLPADEREVVERSCLLDQSLREIGRAMGFGVRPAWRRRKAGLERLRQVLA